LPRRRGRAAPQYTIGVSARTLPQTLSAILTIFGVAARADTLKLTNRPAFGNVTITDFRDDRVVFRGVSGQYLRKPAGEVEWLAIDGQAALNQAEQAAAGGDWQTASAGYEDARPTAGKPWLRRLIAVRLAAACDRGGRFDQAVAVYGELLAADPAAAARHAPRRPGPAGSEVNRRARARIEESLASGPAAPAAAGLRTLLLELLLYEDVTPLPETLGGPAEPSAALSDSQPSDRPQPGSRPTTAPQTAGPLGILPPPDSRPASRPDAAPPQLPPDSFLLDCVQAALDGGDPRRAARLVERATPYAAPCDRGPWRLLLGRCRIESGLLDEAVADLRSLADSDSDPALAGRALYYLGLAYERRRQPEVAAALYAEVLERSDAPEQTKALARDALARLGR